MVHFELPNHDSLTSRLRKIHPSVSYDFGFIQPPMHMRSLLQKTLKILFEKQWLECKKIITCANNNNIWGQVRNYLMQNISYSLTGYLGLEAC